MTSLLIIGANGFVGQKLIEDLNYFKKIYTISRSKLGSLIHQQHHEFQFDISKKWVLNKHSDLIVFCATNHQFSKAEVSPSDYVDTNIIGLINSLEFAKKN